MATLSELSVKRIDIKHIEALVPFARRCFSDTYAIHNEAHIFDAYIDANFTVSKFTDELQADNSVFLGLLGTNNVFVG